jgi:hypothetical protein
MHDIIANPTSGGANTASHFADGKPLLVDGEVGACQSDDWLGVKNCDHGR